jgi:sortase A
MIVGMAQQTVAPEAPTPSNREPRGRALFRVGVVLIVAAAVMLGYAGWQFFGSNAVAHRKQQQLIEQTRRAWAQDSGTSIKGKGRQLHGAEALIRIPRFGKDYLMPVQRGVGDRVLGEGLGHFWQSAGPGQIGNFALAGHRVTHGQPLRDMPELRPGDRVVVETRYRTYTYRIDTDPNRLIVPFTAIWVITPLPTNPQQGGVQPAQRAGQRLITLTTCSELFHTDNRMIAFGHLVDSRPS